MATQNPPKGKPSLNVPKVIGKTLEEIKACTLTCQRCQGSSSRSNVVFGDGNPKARLVFVGEAPSLEDDLQGLPFVGRAGQLLDKMIGAMGLTREEVYVCNILKCRLPKNRAPLPEEITACLPYLHAQIYAIQPDLIVTMGAYSAHAMLDLEIPSPELMKVFGKARDSATGSSATEVHHPLSKLRGRFHDYYSVPLMPTWHPAYLLRAPNRRAETWQDLTMVLDRLELAIVSPKPTRRYNKIFMAVIMKSCQKTNDVHSVTQEHYEDFVNYSNKEMEFIIWSIIRTTVDSINKNVLSGSWNEEDACYHIMLFLELLAEGKIGINEEDGKFGFWKPLGDPPTEEMWDKIEKKIESCRPLIDKVFLDIVHRQKPQI